jgi:hypothetical protein
LPGNPSWRECPPVLGPRGNTVLATCDPDLRYRV